MAKNIRILGCWKFNLRGFDMFVEEFPEEKFPSNRGRDKFVEELLVKVDNKVTEDDLREVSELFDVSKN